MAELSLRQLEYLVAIAEAGSVTAAAAKLHLSQSAVSTALADLERALGAQLFLRHPRGITLTKVGQRVLFGSRRLLSGVEDLYFEAKSETQTLTGRLSVGCFSTLSPTVLPGIIDEFTTRHPEVQLELTEGPHSEMEGLLRSGVIDLAILYEYSFHEVERGTDFVRRTIRVSTPYVLLPVDHALARRKRLKVEQLVDEQLILFDLPPGGQYFLSLFEQLDLMPNILLRSESFELVRSLVARGLGYSLLSQQTQINTSYEGRELAEVPLDGAPRGLNVNVVALRGLQLSRRARAFLACCSAAHPDPVSPPGP